MLCIYVLKDRFIMAKKTKRESQLVIRISGEQRDEFVKMCDALDTSASREIRRFIKEFLRQYKEQGDAADE